MAATAAVAIPSLASSQARPSRSIRIAHLTDTHVQPESGAPEGFRKCLEHVYAQPDRPDLILLGGDLIMDAMARTRDNARQQWREFHAVMRDFTEIPVEACIGNHDIWGWNEARSEATGNEPDFGKKWALDELGLSNPYRSFERDGWKFVVLDSMVRHGTGYKARLDDEQFEWLSGELVGNEKPVLVLSHIPILSASTFFDGDNEKSGDWQVPGAWMHIDARRIKDLFYKHPQVKTAISGHVHLVDRTDYLGVTYYCNGAVCGGWWRGPYQEFEGGYALVDLYADGSHHCEYVLWG
jgi:3',5'-cyclic-AMP phosphodiesterase